MSLKFVKHLYYYGTAYTQERTYGQFVNTVQVSSNNHIKLPTDVYETEERDIAIVTKEIYDNHFANTSFIGMASTSVDDYLVVANIGISEMVSGGWFAGLVSGKYPSGGWHFNTASSVPRGSMEIAPFLYGNTLTLNGYWTNGVVVSAFYTIDIPSEDIVDIDETSYILGIENNVIEYEEGKEYGLEQLGLTASFDEIPNRTFKTLYLGIDFRNEVTISIEPNNGQVTANFTKNGDDVSIYFDHPIEDEYKVTLTAPNNTLDIFIRKKKEEVNNPYDEGGTTGGVDGTSSSGGGGTFGKNEVSDVIEAPNGSVSGSATATGMFTRYLVDSSQLDTVGDWLWATDFGLAVAKAGISLLYGNPIESIVSLMSYPFDIKSLNGATTRTQNLCWGGHNTNIPFTALTNDACYIDWGSININEYWGNFLDYEPHTKIELYLPWGTGFVSIDPNNVMNGSIIVRTNIELSKGSCIHNVFNQNGVVIGSYSGQCGQQIPLMSNDYASKIAGVVTTATALAVAGTAAIGAMGAGADASAGFRAKNPMPMSSVKDIDLWQSKKDSAIAKAEQPYRTTVKNAKRVAATSSIAAARRSGVIARNGAFTDGSASLGVQYPYIILSRPKQSVPREYGNHYGYPSNIYSSLENLKGYTEIGEIHLDGIGCTEEELGELDEILKGGVIF